MLSIFTMYGMNLSTTLLRAIWLSSLLLAQRLQREDYCGPQGRYQIESILGKGGYGITYKAYDWQWQTYVAIKESRPEKADHLRRECALVNFIEEHRNIPDIYEAFIQNGCYYYVMELAGEVSLRQIIDYRPEWLTEEHIRYVMQEVAEALDFIHKRGLIHCDVKPDNIMLKDSSNGVQVYLIDFGAACAQGRGNCPGQYTPAYASPEQYRQGCKGVQADIYAFGATFYHALTRREPPSAPERLRKNAPLSIQTLRPDVSPKLAQLIESCMNLYPQSRPSNMQVILKQLSNIRDEDLSHQNKSGDHGDEDIDWIAYIITMGGGGMLLLLWLLGGGDNKKSDKRS